MNIFTQMKIALWCSAVLRDINHSTKKMAEMGFEALSIKRDVSTKRGRGCRGRKFTEMSKPHLKKFSSPCTYYVVLSRSSVLVCWPGQKLLHPRSLHNPSGQHSRPSEHGTGGSRRQLLDGHSRWRERWINTLKHIPFCDWASNLQKTWRKTPLHRKPQCIFCKCTLLL